jgi:hypothetical protein
MLNADQFGSRLLTESGTKLNLGPAFQDQMIEKLLPGKIISQKRTDIFCLVLKMPRVRFLGLYETL